MNLTYRETELHGQAVQVAFYGPNQEYAFVWHGGAYIDVCFQSSTGSAELDGVFYSYGCQCINVWNYDEGLSNLEWGNEEHFLAECREFLENEMPTRDW